MDNPERRSPDLDWSHAREAVRMLDLAVAQIEFSLREGDDSVETLTQSFTAMAEEVDELAKLGERLKRGAGRNEGGDEVLSHCSRVSVHMQSAIVAFQFYDKLSQRLTHAHESLGQLGGLVADSDRFFSPCEWQALQDKTRSRYTMEQERAMFDALMGGASIDEALKVLKESTAADATTDVDLF